MVTAPDQPRPELTDAQWQAIDDAVTAELTAAIAAAPPPVPPVLPTDPLGDLARYSALLANLPAPPTLHCHPAAYDVLRLTAQPRPSWQPPWGMAPMGATIEIIHDRTMPAGAWEIRRGDDVTASGNVFGEHPPTGPGRVIGADGDAVYWASDTAMATSEYPDARIAGGTVWYG